MTDIICTKCLEPWADESHVCNALLVARLRSEVEYWRETAAHRGQQMPDAAAVAWMRADGENDTLSTMTVCISDRVRELWLKANPKQVERYTIPLYTIKARP